MARHTAKEPQIAPKQALSPLEIRRGIERLQQRIADIEAFDIKIVRSNDNPPELKALSVAIERTLARIFGENTADYHRYGNAADITAVFHFYGDSYPAQQHYVEQIREKLPSSKHMIQEAINALKEELADIESVGAPPSQAIKAPSKTMSRKIFVVHGHDQVSRETVARFLQQLGFDPVILHERPNKGRTIITKFREEAADVGFAVVLMTPDDYGGKQSDNLRPRARQNVVFELGFFFGALGPERVAALVKGEVEHPSDFDGVVYISLDHGHWKIDLAKELKAAGFDVDFNKVIGGGE